MGSVCDALGTTATLNMFMPAHSRWDSVFIEAVDMENNSVLVRPLDRVHPYPYLYTNYRRCGEWIPTTSPRLAPYGSRVKRCTPANAIEYDLIDVRDAKVRHASPSIYFFE